MKHCQGARGFTGHDCLAPFTGEGHYCGSCRTHIRANNGSDAPGQLPDGSPNPGARMFAQLHRCSAERKLPRLHADGHTYEAEAHDRHGVAFFEGSSYVPMRYLVQRHDRATMSRIIQQAANAIEATTFEQAP